jgi:hypothetical protein
MTAFGHLLNNIGPERTFLNLFLTGAQVLLDIAKRSELKLSYSAYFGMTSEKHGQQG